MLSRPPRPSLRPFLRTVWFQDAPATALAQERVLPTGTMHLVVRLDDAPLVLFEGAARRVVGGAVIGGARAEAYVRETGARVRSVGAQLVPGAGPAVLGVPADVLAGAHTALQDVWGRTAEEWREQLSVSDRPLDVFEDLLESRVLGAGAVHPAVAASLQWLEEDADVGDVVARTGYSHRRFIELFRRAVGLGPEAFRRVQRFQRALALSSRMDLPLSAVALDAGFYDQPHFTREFSRMAGLSPRAFRALRPAHAHHVPVNSVQDRRRPGARGSAP